MADGWATFGKGVFVALAVAGGVWIGRGGQLPVLEIPGGGATAERSVQGNVQLGENSAPQFLAEIADRLPVRATASRVGADAGASNSEAQVGSIQGLATGHRQAAEMAIAAAPSPSGIGFAVLGATGNPAPVVLDVMSDKIRYRAGSEVVVRILPANLQIRLQQSQVPRYLKFQLGESTDAKEVPAGAEVVEINVPPGAAGRQLALTFSDKDGNTGTSASAKIPIRLPLAQPNVSVRTVSNVRIGGMQPIENNVPVTAFKGFLRIGGTGNPGSRIRLIVDRQLTTSSDEFVVYQDPAAIAEVGPDEAWEAVLRLPFLPPGQVARVACVVSSGLQNDFAATMPQFTIGAQSAGVSISLDKITRKGLTDVLSDPIRLNVASIDAFWSASPKETSGCAAVLMNNGVEQSQVFQLLSPPPASDPTAQKLSWNVPTEGRHELSVVLIQGENIIARSSESRIIDFNQHGPVASGFEVINPLKTPGATVLRVPFKPSNPLAAAPGAANFVLKRDRDQSLTFTPTLTFDESANTVELKFTPALESDGYTLTIFPVASSGDSETMIVDRFGNLLGAVPGSTASKESTFTFFKSVGEELPSQSRGISGVTGENAVYPEYTKPRPQQDGFNPSDKVVTRIARLYYFRDAHRVVQLLNREARSYNRQAVDQQQQLADNALRDVENATTDRREAERAAVRAAQQARAAENGLVQAQAALAKAKADNDRADNGITAAQNAVRDHTTERDAKKADAEGAAKELQSLEMTTDPKPSDAQLAAAKVKKATTDGEYQKAETRLVGFQDQLDELVRQRDQSAARVTNATRLVNTALAEVQASRTTEITATDKSSGLEAKEDQAQKTLFRREVAAANADPDTYARGNPESVDPLLQVSYSVIGEGEIQLRGPLKGVNLARTLINQIDSPVGQVRVAIHTIQVNGERGERMEPVVERIGRYVDQSRFLTSQSGQMLRNAVTMVAARKAEEAFVECEGFIEADHQAKYLEAFFGKQFIDELREMDSEFLRADNKLLSLHSMDSTSLAQALFLLALAKNDIRQEILCEFERMTTCDLPLAETEYFGASGAAWKFGPPFHKQKYQFLGHNARFVSLRGQFNVQVADPDTITPMQREFIRLAQIFKSRLVAEREIQQRVMERGLIEDRFETYLEEQRQAATRERQDRLNRENAIRELESTRLRVSDIFTEFITELREEGQAVASIAPTSVRETQDSYRTDERAAVISTIVTLADTTPSTETPYIVYDLGSGYEGQSFFIYKVKRYGLSEDTFKSQPQRSDSYGLKAYPPSAADPDSADIARPSTVIQEMVERAIAIQRSRIDTLSRYKFPTNIEKHLTNASDNLETISKTMTRLKSSGKFVPSRPIDLTSLQNLRQSMLLVDAVYDAFVAGVDELEMQAAEILSSLTSDDGDESKAYAEWLKFKHRLSSVVLDAGTKQHIEERLKGVDDAFAQLAIARGIVTVQQRIATEFRRPLDHKKFMDMLVDDAEDKYIEILEGTRAHTANIDNYLGRIITSLDDDFNAQFYNPTFKHIREAGRYWDVQMGQIETTTVLTNNRTFAKVSPQAQMEFDLPKRDILISEAFESAAAAYQDYGALLQDPTFLSLTKMYRGQPPSATYGSALPTPMVRDVLPGLPSATNEQMMIQEGTASPDFPSALESLIPDPAIYKFETGTGFEVRPVIQPDGQAVTFHLNYMYTTNVREPARADEKHLGRIKRHFVDTDVTLGNFEMREVSKYTVALKASRTARGVPLLEDVPVAGILFRPLPQQQSSLQQNVILSQATIFPTLFDLMGLRWAPAIADLGTGNLKELDFVTKNRRRDLQHRVFDYSSSQVDEFLRIPEADRRRDLYRPQTPIDEIHPDGSVSPGMNLKELRMMEEPVPDSSGPDAESSSLQLPPGPTLSTVPEERNLPSLGEVPVIQQQSYQVPAKDTWRSAKPQRLPQISPAAPRKPAARPAEPKRLPTQDKPGSVKMLGPQSSRTKLSAESPIVLTSATRTGDDAPVMLLDRSEDDLFAAPEIRPVSELRSEPRDDTVAKDAGKRRWFKLPFLSRSK